MTSGAFVGFPAMPAGWPITAATFGSLSPSSSPNRPGTIPAAHSVTELLYTETMRMALAQSCLRDRYGLRH